MSEQKPISEGREETILYSSYTIYDLKKPYRVNVPFICERCGRCCQAGYPSKGVEDQLLEYLGFETTDEGLQKCIEQYIGKIHPDGSFTRFQPCGFLKDNECIVHPVKPLGCKSYPIMSDSGPQRDEELNPLCPGYIRQRAIIRRLLRGYVSWTARGREYPKNRMNELDKISGVQWKRVMKKFLSMEPSAEELRLFKKLNLYEEGHEH